MSAPIVHHRRNARKLVAEINVVPYIDVMLVLLVIFMITTPLLYQGVDVSLPKATSKPLSQNDKPPVIITINSAGDLYINTHEDPEKKLSSDLMLATLRTIRYKDPTRQIVLRGDQSVRYGKIVELMVLLQQANIDNVGLMTEESDS